MAKKILIIDDEEDMLEMLQIVFQDSDYNVVLSNKGMRYDQIQVIHPDLILLDVQIKGYGMTGNEICKELKAQPSMEKLPVFLMSAEYNLSALAHECHADGYFNKPFNISNLKTTIANELA
jgi:two-component system response regulator VicR